ncbi:MAG: alpha/beta fold hydrolase [Myxococcales bacterium]|nr:MAG: alpha/beta fold hydrolase [Myxococcales bacterium]
MPYASAMELLHTAHVPAGEGPFPTIVALHGWGASAHDLLGLAPVLHGGEALVLCPQGPVALEVAPGMLGYGWFPITMGRPPDPAEFAKGAAALRAFLDAALASYPIDCRKLVVLGFSQGGVMAYDLALREPERFAGLVALSSWLPDALADAVPRQPAHAELPTLVTHGTGDPMIPIERGRSSRDRLLALGVPTTYREYEMEHEIRPEALRDVVAWLDDRVLRPVRRV